MKKITVFALTILASACLFAGCSDDTPDVPPTPGGDGDGEEVIEPGTSRTPDDMPNPDLDYYTHCFYYHWYGDLEFDGGYFHWTHEIAPDPNDPNGQVEWIDALGPNLGSDFYPLLGKYSSSDPELVAAHMDMFVRAGIGVLVLSWWAPDQMVMDRVPLIMDAAAKVGIKVCVNIEPYGGRSVETIRRDIEDFIKTYKNYRTYYTVDGKPVFYVYNAFEFGRDEWHSLLAADGRQTIRGTALDSHVIGLIYEVDEEPERMISYEFDGYYTYFGSDLYYPSAAPSNWPRLQALAESENVLFVPSVAPGYKDEHIRPWNSGITVERHRRERYRGVWESAIATGCPYIAITSFNEWHEGTQIEPAIPYDAGTYDYSDYEGLDPFFYLDQTALHISTFAAGRNSDR